MAPRSGTATDYLARLSELEKALEEFDADSEIEDENKDREAKEKLQSILRDICTVAREAEELEPSNLNTIISQADNLINQAINIAYGGIDAMLDSLPSFAHSVTSPLIGDGSPVELLLRAYIYFVINQPC